MKLFLILCGMVFYSINLRGALAGGRPNSISGGQNAFAGISNPANAVFIPDRIDLGVFWVHQNSSLTNHENNPLFNPGTIDTAYKSHNLINFDGAITKQIPFNAFSKSWETSVSFATYSTPTRVEVRTKNPIPLIGTTPIVRKSATQVYSAIFSLKLNDAHSWGCSLDYYNLLYERKGNQNADNAIRSVSPGHVTNNGVDRTSGFGVGLGWRWKINSKLDFGLSWISKSYIGRLKKYRGFEPYHGKSYIPQTLGAGIGYRLSPKIAGRMEVLWIQSGNIPNANNNLLSNGAINTNKRGSSKSPGPGLQDATLLNLGLGYQLSPSFSLGLGYSHRLRTHHYSTIFIDHTYRLQTIYDFLTIGSTLRYHHHEFFLGGTKGFKNKVAGKMPPVLGSTKFSGNREVYSLSFSWGYLL